MSVARVQYVKANSSTFGASSRTVALTATTGNLLLAVGAITQEGWSATPITDGVNTWTEITVSGGAAGYRMWYAKNITGGALNVVFTNLSGFGGGSIAAAVMELSGADLTNPVHLSSGGHGTTTALSSGATGTCATTDYVVGLGSWGIKATSTPVTVSGRAFSTALSSQTDETEADGTSTGNPDCSSVAISDGPPTGANAETFSGTISGTPFGWSAWCLCIAVPGTASANSGFLGFM